MVKKEWITFHFTSQDASWFAVIAATCGLVLAIVGLLGIVSRPWAWLGFAVELAAAVFILAVVIVAKTGRAIETPWFSMQEEDDGR